MKIPGSSPRRASNRRRAPAVLGAVIAIGISLVPITDAAAARKTPGCSATKPVSPCVTKASQTGWFWSSNTSVKPFCKPVGANPEDPTATPCTPEGTLAGGSASGGQATNPITLGHIGVSMKDGESDMRGYVQVDLSGIPPGADVSSLVMTLTVSVADNDHTQYHEEASTREAQGKPPATVNQTAAGIDACAVTGPWTTAAGDPEYTTTVDPDKLDASDPNPNDGVSTTTIEPPHDCSLKVQGERAKDGSTWSFDLTAIAKKWLAGEVFDNGVALLPQPLGIKPNWVVEFHGAQFQVDTNEDDPVHHGEPSEFVRTKEAVKAKAEFSGGLAPPPPPPPPPPDLGTETGGPLPTFGSETPPTEAPPVTTEPPPATGPIAPTPVGGSGKTSGWVYALFPLGILGLGLVSSAIGPDEGAVAKAGNRVASLLQGRRLAGAEALSEVESIASEELSELEQ